MANADRDLMEAAERLAAAIRTGSQIDAAAAFLPETLQQAEEVQDRVLQKLGWTHAAWKLGASNLASRNGLGLPRSFSAPLPAERLLRSPARLSMSAVRQPGVECELAVSFAASPGSVGDLASMPSTELLAATESAAAEMHAAIEIPGSRYPHLGGAGPLALVADNGAADWMIMGDGIPADFGRSVWRGHVQQDGATVLEGDTLVFCDSPLNLLADHVRRMAARGHAILPGSVVLLGSITPRHAVSSPCEIEVGFDKLPPVRLTFAP